MWTDSNPTTASTHDTKPVDVWLIGLDGLGDCASSALCAALNADERRRMARFLGVIDAQRWGHARGVMREVLASYVGISSSEIVFRLGDSGKPALVGVGENLHFNISHCGPTALLAVAFGREVGVDVERIREGLHEGEIAQRVLGDEAVRLAMIASPQDRTRAFFRSWVRHEAMVKCRGAGLGDASGEGPTNNLWLEEIDLGESHAAALVVNVGAVDGVRAARPYVRRLVWRPRFGSGERSEEVRSVQFLDS